MRSTAATRRRALASRPIASGHVWEDDLALTHRLADIADAVTMSRFLSVDLRVETKPDTTPVTDADQATEAALRAELTASRPGDGVLGEEEGMQGDLGARRWVLDPIDGTKNFLRGVPVWGTLIALEDTESGHPGNVVVGMVSAPALGRRWWAARGLGAWSRTTLVVPESAGPGNPFPLVGTDRRLQVSGVRELHDASFAFSSMTGWRQRGVLDGFLQLAENAWRSRAFGDFWSHLMVAEGAVDVSAEPEVAHWDIAPLQVIIEEAGGQFTDLAGEPRPDGGSILSSNGLLHEKALALLR